MSKSIPPGWEVANFDTVFSQISTTGKKVKTGETQANGKFPVVDQGRTFISGYLDDENLVVSADEPLIIFGDHTREIKWIDFSFIPGADGVKILRPESAMDAKFLYFFLRNLPIESKGYARHFRLLKEANYLVPPLAEQICIAKKLDELLAQVYTLKARIDAIPPLLKRFRQSVLATAVSGERSSAASAPSVSLSDICFSITDGDHQAPPQSDTGIPFITISAINDGVIRLEKATRYVPASYFAALNQARRPQKGDILFSVTGSICIPAMVLSDESFTFQRHIAILRPNTSLALQKYLYFYLSSEQIKKQGLSVATGTAQLTVPLKGLRNFKISLPSLEEQVEIVRRVELLFAFADQLEAKISTAQARIDRLTQSILATAFRGELVPQNPNDEPATELLSRITMQSTNSLKTRKSRVPRSTRASKESNTMSKYRQDADVLGQPYLADHLRRLNSQVTAEALFKVAELPVADFYKQLAWEIEQGLIVDYGQKLGAHDAA